MDAQKKKAMTTYMPYRTITDSFLLSPASITRRCVRLAGVVLFKSCGRSMRRRVSSLMAKLAPPRCPICNVSGPIGLPARSHALHFRPALPCPVKPRPPPCRKYAGGASAELDGLAVGREVRRQG